MTYCCAVWSTNYPSNLKRIETYQRKLVRIITRSGYDAHAPPLFKQLKIVKFEDISVWSILKIMYIYHHQSQTQYNRLKLFTVNERHLDKYRIPFGRLETTRFSISFRGPVLWNDLDVQTKNLPTIHSFKRKFYSSVLERY